MEVGPNCARRASDDSSDSWFRTKGCRLRCEPVEVLPLCEALIYEDREECFFGLYIYRFALSHIRVLVRPLVRWSAMLSFNFDEIRILEV